MLHVLFGAVAGAVIGAGSVALTSVIRGKPIDWKSVGSAALGGAAIGAIGAATFGGGLLAGSAALKTTGMVVAGASGGAIEQTADNAFHGRELSEGVAESAAVGGAIGLLGAGARSLRKPLMRLVRNPGVRRVVRNLAQRGKKLPGQAWQSLKSGGSTAANAIRRRASQLKINLALGRKSVANALKPVSEPLAKAGRRFVADPFAKHVANPLKRRVGDPLKRHVFEPTKRALAPFAARIGRTRAGQATKKLWGRYLGALKTHPVRTKSLTSAGIGATGDLIAQSTDNQEGIDLKRTAFIAGFGLAYGGPVGHWWFNTIERLIPGGGKALLAKVVVDQVVMNTAGTQVFFTSRGVILEGKPLGEAFSTGWESTKDVVPKSWGFWGPFHAINFSKVPLPLRKPVADAAGLVWGTIFSRLAFDKDEAEAEPEPTATEGTTTSGPQAETPRVSNELEANLDGMIDVFTPARPRTKTCKEGPVVGSCLGD